MTDLDRPAGLDLLFTRRSVSNLADPAPTPEQLDLLLAAAAAVPDHGLLRPWRFVVVSGEGRRAFGDALAAAAAEARPDTDPAALDKIRRKPLIAPTQIVLLASPVDSPKVPEWEQVASAACTGYAILLAAGPLGLGAVWKSTHVRDGADLRALLGMAAREQLLGWVNVGRPVTETMPERPAVALSDVAAVLDDARPARPYTRPAGVPS